VPKPLTERAKQRLRLLAGLLRTRGQKFDMPRDQFYDEIQAAEAALPKERQSELKSLVDWLEDYERAELASEPSEPKRRALKAKPLPQS